MMQSLQLPQRKKKRADKPALHRRTSMDGLLFAIIMAALIALGFEAGKADEG